MEYRGVTFEIVFVGSTTGFPHSPFNEFFVGPHAPSAVLFSSILHTIPEYCWLPGSDPLAPNSQFRGSGYLLGGFPKSEVPFWGSQ